MNKVVFFLFTCNFDDLLVRTVAPLRVPHFDPSGQCVVLQVRIRLVLISHCLHSHKPPSHRVIHVHLNASCACKIEPYSGKQISETIAHRCCGTVPFQNRAQQTNSRIMYRSSPRAQTFVSLLHNTATRNSALSGDLSPACRFGACLLQCSLLEMPGQRLQSGARIQASTCGHAFSHDQVVPWSGDLLPLGHICFQSKLLYLLTTSLKGCVCVGSAVWIMYEQWINNLRFLDSNFTVTVRRLSCLTTGVIIFGVCLVPTTGMI